MPPRKWRALENGKIEFDYAGTTFKLFKRAAGKFAAWWIKFMWSSQKVYQSCGTHDTDAAIDFAKTQLIDPVVSGRPVVRPAPVAAPVAAPAKTSLLVVFEHYDKICIKSSAVQAKNALLWVVRTARENDELQAEQIFTSELNAQLVKDCQRAYARRLLAALPVERREDSAAVRETTERANRTSRSYINQARAVFAMKKGFMEEYRQAGLNVPQEVEKFCKCFREGSSRKANYHAPGDDVWNKIWKALPALAKVDPDAHLCFWLAVGTGARRGEISRMEKNHFREVNGKLCVAGGTGKDGERISIGVMDKAVTLIRARLKELKSDADTLLPGPITNRYDNIPDRLNAWLRSMGFTDTEKVMHELRAWVGSKIYERDPLAARDYLRHKNLSTTTECYGRYVRVKAVTDVL